ncbi:glycosyltransferase family protein [Rhizorhabdus argentea]|uniref:hypothetical protein n=1 Tax=Rhizorhabdus argentea TaxID=1387174 RepID=UPI0030EDD370
MVELTILQTSDAFKYSRMLRATSRTAIEYCRRHGFAYESFIGIKRGFHGAQAAFNRIFLLEELAHRGYQGWALYMDADAYIYDLDFDLRAYLADKQDRSAIMATIPGETIPWHINSGVLFFNLGHPQSLALIAEWKRRFMALPEERLRNLLSVWDHENDQTMLYEALDQYPTLREPVAFVDALLFNHNLGQFIRQFLNSLDGNIDSRTATIEGAVAEVLQGISSAEEDVEERLVGDFYRIVFGRDPDPASKGYVDLIRTEGLIRATPVIISSLLNSEEYRRKIGG